MFEEFASFIRNRVKGGRSFGEGENLNYLFNANIY